MRVTKRITGDTTMAKQKKGNGNNSGKMKRKVYEKELRKLQVELCHLQEWVKAKHLKVIIVFEGRDAAGKGGTIKALTERVSPRVFRVVALPALRTAKRHRCTCSVTLSVFLLPARSSSSTAVGTIAQV
jgi:polyphosphate kinase 2 (PPK2 family)